MRVPTYIKYTLNIPLLLVFNQYKLKYANKNILIRMPGSGGHSAQDMTFLFIIAPYLIILIYLSVAIFFSKIGMYLNKVFVQFYYNYK